MSHHRLRPAAALALALALAALPLVAPEAAVRFCSRTDVGLGTNGPYAIVTGDFYGSDGAPDLAVTFGASRRLVLLANDGTGTFTVADVLEPPNPDTGSASHVSDPAAIIAADFNEDGFLDVAGTNRTTLRFFAYRNPNAIGAWGATLEDDSRRANGTDITAAYWDGDAALDIVMVTEAGAVAIALGEVDGFGLPLGSWGSVQRFTTTAQVGVFNDVDVANFVNVPGEAFVVPDVLAVDNQYAQLVIWPGDSNFRGFVLSAPASLVRIPVQDAAGNNLSPIEAFVEDWSGDGRPDALVVTAEGIVLYYASNGTATVFGAPTRYDLAAGYALGPRLPTDWTAVLLEDVVGNDGIRDLIVADAGEPAADRGFNWISVIPGTADRPSAPAFDVDTRRHSHWAMGNMSALRPGSIAAADVDADLDLDVIVLHGDQNSYTLLRNDGSGGFDAPPSYSSGAATPRSAASGRLDADSQEDVVVGCVSAADPSLRTAVVFRGLGPVLLGLPDAQPAPGMDQPSGATVASVNSAEDALLDIVLTFSADQALWRGNGDATFGNPTPFGSGTPVAGRLDLANLFGDAALDAAVVERSPVNRVRTFLGDGRGSFTLQQTFDFINGGQDVASGRFFGGASPDLVVSGLDDINRPGLHIFRWDDATSRHLPPTFMASEDFGLGATDFAFLEVADFEVGGAPELLGVSSSGDAFMFKAIGGTFQLDVSTAPIGFGGDARAVVVRDLTGDGTLDVAVAERAVIRIREGRPNGSFDPVVSLPANIATEGLTAADLDGNGLPELIAVSSRTNDLTVFCNNSVGSLILRVGFPAAGHRLNWGSQGAGATYSVASGQIHNLWVNRDLRDAICLTMVDPSLPYHDDLRPLPPPPGPPVERTGFYYLVKCEGGECSEPTFGFTSLGDPRFGPGSPGNVPDPCP